MLSLLFPWPNLLLPNPLLDTEPRPAGGPAFGRAAGRVPLDLSRGVPESLPVNACAVGLRSAQATH